MIQKKKSALLMVDLQNDFCPGGNLAIPEGDEVIGLANRLQPFFDVVLATQDWHPSDHLSFASNHSGKHIGEVVQLNGLEQVLWPDHCVQESEGAKLHPQLDTKRIHKIFYKGQNRYIDSYSAFYDNGHLQATGLSDYLLAQGITDLYILGLATDYCVKYSCLDAVKLPLHVYVIQDACRGVGLQDNDIANAFAQMQNAGARLIQSDEIIKGSCANA